MDTKKLMWLITMGLFILVFGGLLVSFSITGMQLFKNTWFFKNPTAYKLVWAMLPFASLSVISSIGILCVKEWGRKMLIVTCPFIFITYILLILADGIDLMAITVLFSLTPLFFLYLFGRPSAKKLFA